MSSAVQRSNVIVDGTNLTEKAEQLQSKLRHPAFAGGKGKEMRGDIERELQSLQMEICWAWRSRPAPDTPSGVLFFAQSSN